MKIGIFNRQEIQSLEQASISNATIWLRRTKHDDMIGELEKLASRMLR